MEHLLQDEFLVFMVHSIEVQNVLLQLVLDLSYLLYELPATVPPNTLPIDESDDRFLWLRLCSFGLFLDWE